MCGQPRSAAMRPFPPVTRRKFLAVSTSAAALSVARPYISRANDRPLITHGVQSGDVGVDSGVVWARTDRPARMQIEIATTDSFRDVRQGVFVDALPQSDFTAKALLEDLPPGQDIFYRIRFQDHSSPTILSEPAVGRFRTAPATRRNVSFVWGGDVCGQGWGINLERGGMRCFATMHKNRPDFFVHCGDTIYADHPLQAEVKLADGTIWKNVVTEARSKVAETLDEYRDNYKYNLTDKNVLALNAEVPIFAQWDDHEVFNDWYPTEPIGREEHKRRKLTVPNMLTLMARGSRAFHEYMPIRSTPAEPGRVYRQLSYGPLLDVFMIDTRSYRGPNGANMEESYGPSAYYFAPAQVAWLKRSLARSRAVWKVISCDMPLALHRAYQGADGPGSDALAQNDNGPPRGREHELADILSFIRRENIRNTVWITADVHYTAAHYFDPNKAAFQDFDPFWEFIAGPLNAGTAPPIQPETTFGCRVEFSKGSPVGTKINHGPSYGMQFFGHIAIDGTTGELTVSLKDQDDTVLWSRKLEPRS
jgi:alkaline phosphatase D